MEGEADLQISDDFDWTNKSHVSVFSGQKKKKISHISGTSIPSYK